jgi:hypothetical protein
VTAAELADLVARMRRAQRTYFKVRTSENLSRAKQLEREVDAALETHFARQPSLFGAGDPDSDGGEID